MPLPKVVMVIGPTAVGKTALAIEIAKVLGAPILNADSRQFYRGIPIGTAQPTPEELQAVPHSFVGHLELDQLYSAGEFASDAEAWIVQHPISIVVGGSGLYLQALLDGLDEVPRNLHVRDELNRTFAKDGLAPLVAELQSVDPKLSERMDLANPQRVIRALEVYRSTGRPMSSYQNKTKRSRPFDVLVMGLERPKAELDQRIEMRTTAMVEAGFEEEARAVWPLAHHNSLQTVGYREWFAHFNGELTRVEALEWIRIRTRQFAKRQMTWFKRMEGVEWFDGSRPNQAIERALEWTQTPQP